MVIDEDDDVHVFYEAKFYSPPHADVEIAYKRKGNTTLWHPDSIPVFVTPSGCGCYAHSPHVYLDDSTQMLHLVCGTPFPDSCGHVPPGSDDERLYTSKSLDVPDNEWAAPSFIENPIGGGVVVLNGVVHFFGKREEGGDVKIVHVIYRCGVPPDPGEEWDFAVEETLDIFERPMDEDEPIEIGPCLTLSGTDSLHFVWHRFEDDQTTKAVYFATAALGASGQPVGWWPEHEGDYPWGHCLSPPDEGAKSGAASLVVADNGTVHVMYHEPGCSGFNEPRDNDFFHLYNATDVTDPTAWSYRTHVSSDKATDAKAPNMVVREDSVYVSYSDYANESFDAWFRLGYEIPDTVAGGTVPWSGRVFLDADVYIAAGGELKIAEGTKVFVTGNHDRLQGGMDPERIELIVAGTLTLEGDPSYPDSFVVFDGTGGQDWYGIWLTSGGKLNVGHTVMEDAVAAISTPIPGNPTAFLNEIDSKLTFIDCTDTLLFMAPPWEKTIWSSNVSLPVDFLVAPGGSLEINAGVTVTAEANKDVEIRVDGPLLALGQDDNNRVTFTSSNTNPGSWDGIRFIDGSDDTTTSSLEYVEIEYPVFGVQLDSLSGTLFKPHFTGVVDDNDIYLDRDTRIPYGCEWNLDAPTTVVAEAGTDFHATGEVDTLVEIVVNGALRTQSASPGTYYVEFTSTAKDSLNGDDWYGITVRGDGMTYGIGIADVKHSDIAFAHYPLAFMIADSAAVTDSRFHHYKNDAVLDWGSDAFIVGNYIHRGEHLNAYPPTGSGRVGIHLASTFGLVERDTVFYQLDNGIWADFSQGYCELTNPPWAPEETLVIRDNVVVGQVDNENSGCTGVLLEWVCHERNVLFEDSNIQNWTYSRGVRLNNCADVVVKCNCIKNNKIGVKHERKYVDVDSQNGNNLFRQNNFEANENQNVKVTAGAQVVHGPDSVTCCVAGMYLGKPGNSATGLNCFVQKAQATKNVYLDASEYYRADTAMVNVWYDENGGLIDHLEGAGGIDSTNFYRWWGPFYQDIEADQFISAEWKPDCSTDTACALPTIPAGSVRRQGARAEIAAEPPPEGTGEASSADGETVLPEHFALYRPRPNPAVGYARIDVDVPRDNQEVVELAIYDVSGRRVRSLLEKAAAAGRYSLAWDLRDDRGRRVAAGVYFVRIVCESYRATEKLVLLQ
jgi:hypothetical protein